MLKRRMLPLLVLAAATMSAVLPAQTTQTLPPTVAETQLPAIQGTGRYVTSSDGTLIAVTDSGPKFSPVTMDLRGFGYSSKPTDPAAYSDLNLQADDIEAVIHQLGLVKPVLAGWSLGGIAVQGYLEKYGDNELSGVDMVDSIVCPDTACQQTIFGGLANFPAVNQSVSTDANTALTGEEGFVNLETGGTEQPSPVLSATDRLVLEEIAHTSPQFARAAALNGAATDLTPRPEILENLHVPLLVQHGTNDPIFPASLIPNEVKLVKNATVKTYANVAHMPFLLTPNAFNFDLQSWVLTKVLIHLP
jgi:non-heme chloroperoxidase